MSKAEVSNFKEAVVHYKEDGDQNEIRVRESPSGYIIYDFSSGLTPYSVGVTKRQWKAIKKAVKALKRKKHRVKEPDPATGSPDEHREPT